MTSTSTENKLPCVWATSKDHWDSFLNDPELARAIDSVRQDEAASDEKAVDTLVEQAVAADQIEKESSQSIGARLRAYETPITDEILRQSIR